jgi:uncharacterized protein DUF3224
MTTATAARASGTFRVTSMDEDAYQSLEGGGKLTRARGDQDFSGDIKGQGHVEWLMCYREDGSARFVGHQLMRGSIGGRAGTFVIEASGDYNGSTSRGDWWVVPGSGTELLEGISGKGSFEAAKGPLATYQLNYELT